MIARMKMWNLNTRQINQVQLYSYLGGAGRPETVVRALDQRPI